MTGFGLKRLRRVNALITGTTRNKNTKTNEVGADMHADSCATSSKGYYLIKKFRNRKKSLSLLLVSFMLVFGSRGPSGVFSESADVLKILVTRQGTSLRFLQKLLEV